MSEPPAKRRPRRRRRRGSDSTLRPRRIVIVGAFVTTAAVTAAVVAAVLFLPGGGPSDEDAITSLAQRSIEVLPLGEWPSLYDSYTSEFQQRCSPGEFNQAGVAAATELGDDLLLLRFIRLESLTIDGSSAQAVIVGEIAGQGEYQIQAAFQKEGGDWKIAPAGPDTQGCQAFLSS